MTVPIITVDGPSGSGKGTLCFRLSQALGWHLLDSGALYRLTALCAKKHGINLDDAQAVAAIAEKLDVSFPANAAGEKDIILENQCVSADIREEAIGVASSKISAYPQVRKALLLRQQSFATMPGLVADGRDMGSVVFPEANCKFYLDASVDVRAQRRFKELQDKGISVKFDALLLELQARDDRDRSRVVSPLVVPEGAVLIDSDQMTIDQVFSFAMDIVRQQIA